MFVDLRRLAWIPISLLAMLVAACAGPSGGGYYKGDGPGDRSASEFLQAPDAAPRDEPIYEPSTRPYRVYGKRYVPLTERQPYYESGVASWYGRHFQGKPTSIGEPYDMYAMTAAHPTLPLPSYVKVTNRVNGRSVVVRVNDRGPFLNGRIIDLSFAAAAKLGYAENGVAAVDIEVVDPQVVAMNRDPARQRALALADQLRALDRADAGASKEGAPTEGAPTEGAPAKEASAAPAEFRSIGPITQARVGQEQQLPVVQVAGSTSGSAVPFVIRFETVETPGARPAVPERKPTAARSNDDPAPAADTPPLIPEPEPSVFLQLGAFGTEQAAAQALLTAMEQFIWMAVDVRVVVERGLHKLQAGPFRDATEARWAANRIREESALSPFYVIR
ncbi:MAG: septal ring lytic transglycosylase RlpA family protein [Burkholderiaceae bacterium]